MPQATKSNTYRNGSEPMDNGSKPMDSTGTVQIPFEAIRAYANQSLVTQLKECQTKLKKAEEKIIDLKDTCADQSVELHKIKKELKEKESSVTTIDFYPIYDTRMYTDARGNHPTAKWVRNLWDVLYAHSLNTLDNGSYYIENSTSVALVYKLVHESNRIAFQFTGSYDDFSYSWNANVAERITDKNHATMLTCAGASIKSEYNKKHWKEVLIGTLERNPNPGGKHSRMYGKANIIIKRIMPDITTLAAR